MVIDLEQKSGLKLKFDAQNHQLIFEDPEIIMERFEIKTFSEMKRVIKNNNAKFPRNNAYHIYRNLRRKTDEEKINSAGLRYDITVIPPGLFVYKDQKEFVRTSGHYHEIKAGTGTGFPEIYEVICGKALFLMQKPDESDYAKLLKIYAVEAVAGEKAIILPGFGHVSVNTADEPLVLSNWTGNTFRSNYEPYKKYRGGGYWLMRGENGEISFKKNGNYVRVPEIRKLKPRELPELGIFQTEPFYRLVYDFAKLKFLLYPEEFKKQLTVENCYERELQKNSGYAIM